MNRYSKTITLIFVLVMVATLIPAAVPGADASRPTIPTYLYKTTFVRAAPGKLLDFILLYKSLSATLDSAKDERPLWWRHAEGDQWDLMLIFPMGSYEEYYSKERIALRAKAEEVKASLKELIAWQEDLFVLGPPLETVKKAFEEATFYHIEMFVALPGKLAGLLQEREMENVYQVELGRPPYLNFIRESGAAWDAFSLGCYRDMLHWADTANIPQDKKDLAARRSGFRDSAEIGLSMRTLIDMHRDTMGSAIK